MLLSFSDWLLSHFNLEMPGFEPDTFWTTILLALHVVSHPGALNYTGRDFVSWHPPILEGIG